MEIVFNRPRGQIVQWDTRRRKHTRLPHRYQRKPRQESPTGESTLPSPAGSGGTLRAIQTTQPSTPRLVPEVPEGAAAGTAQTLIQRKKAQSPGETRIPDSTPVPEQPLLWARILTRILMLAKILILVGILIGIPILARIFIIILRLVELKRRRKWKSWMEPQPLTELKPRVLVERRLD